MSKLTMFMYISIASKICIKFCVKFGGLMALKMSMFVSWVVTPCGLAGR
jgi:hypothetical protein